MPYLKDDCYQSANGYCFCLEFQTGKLRRGFQASQFIEFTLEEIPEAKEAPNQPTERLVLAFSTADVTIVGWRLGRLADLLRENKLAAVGTLPKRDANLDPGKPHVAAIVITPIPKP